MGTSGKRGIEEWNFERGASPEEAPTPKTKTAVDRRQNNRMLIKAVSVRHCAVSIPHHVVAVPTAMQNRVTKTMSVAPPLGNN